MKVYISGPMTGHKDYNRAAFEAAAEALRAKGFDVMSPIERDKERGFDLSGPLTNEKYWELLSDDIRTIGQGIDAMYVLPFWPASRGARLEVFQAVLMRIPVYSFTSKMRLWPLAIMEFLTESIKEGK